ncbi:pimeloyl-ACP methyl ester carboxylesterase [Nocardia sp. GAS34]|uniref:alpha/beta fold hydrolase n=1 Tax=unclassified Nocardia TaxID=2637762 RepID=UPI003D1CF50A
MTTTITDTIAFVTSSDGTRIAYERSGSGPAVVVVDGALCHREMGPARSIAAALADRYTVFAYDRRGRGESGDSAVVDTGREVEDLQAVIAAAGEPVHVVALSSGCPLALSAIQRGSDIVDAALYEFPLIVDDSRDPAPADYLDQQRASVAAGNPGAAVRRFMRLVGMPAPLVLLFPLLPVWSKLKRAGHTLVNDALTMGDALDGQPIPVGRYADVTVPVTVLVGGKSPAWMRNGNSALAAAIPGAFHRVLPGQDHMIKGSALAPALTEIFG